MDGVILHPTRSSRKANIGAVEVEVRQVLIEPQSGALPYDQDDFVQRLDRNGALKRRAVHGLARGVEIAAKTSVCSDAVTSHHSPPRIQPLQNFERALKLAHPVLAQENVLVSEDDKLLLATVNGLVIRRSRRLIIPLNDDLVRMTGRKAGRGKKVAFKYSAIIRSNSKCEVD